MSANLSNVGYYVYALSDPRNHTVFYIGKGRGRRYLSHERSVRKHGPSLSEKDQKIYSIIEEGLCVSVTVLHKYLSEQEALDQEAMEIESLGIESLTNVRAKGTKGSNGRAGIGLGRQLADTWLSLPDSRCKVCSTLLPSMTPAFLHGCMEDALAIALKDSRSRHVVEGISKAIEGKHTGKHSPIG